MMFVRMVLCGAVAALVVGAANALAQLQWDWNLTNLMFFFVLPGGAFLLGAMSGAGAGVATDLHADRKLEALSLLVAGGLTGFLTILAFYSIEGALIAPDLSFGEYLQLRLSSLAIAGSGDSSVAMGDFGLVVGGLDFIGGPIGGIGGALLSANWRRQSAGVKALPKWTEDSSVILCAIAHADEVVREEEIRTVFKALLAQAGDHYQAKEGKDDQDLRQHLAALVVEKLDGPAPTEAQISQSLKRLSKIPKNAKAFLFLAAACIAESDGECDESEVALLTRLEEALRTDGTETVEGVLRRGRLLMSTAPAS